MQCHEKRSLRNTQEIFTKLLLMSNINQHHVNCFFSISFCNFFFVKSYQIGLAYSKSNSIKSFGLHLSVNQTVQWRLVFFMWMCYFTHKIYESNSSRMRVKKVPNSNTENRMIICIDSITYKLINPKQI